MKHWLQIAFLCACAHAAAEPADDLFSLYTQARSTNPTLQKAATQIRAASADADATRAALLPQWHLGATRKRSGASTAHSETSKITQSLINLAALSNWQAARADVQVQEANLRTAEQALLAEVAVRYFDLLTAESRLATQHTNETAFAELLRQSEVRVAERLSAPVDVDLARAFLGLAQGTTQEAREAVADARQALVQLTGRMPQPLKPLQRNWKPVALPASSDEWVAQALLNHPQLNASQAAIAAAQERIREARAGHLPTLALTVEAERAQRDTQTPRTSTHSTVGIQLSIPLFMGGAMVAQEKSAVAKRDAELAQIETARREIERHIRAQWQTVQSGVTQIGTAEVAASAAGRALAAMRVGLQNGTRSLTDVLGAIRTKGEAELQLTQVRHRHVVALLLLKQAAGNLVPDDLANINAWLDFRP